MLLCRNRLKTVTEYRTSDGSKYPLGSSSWDLQTEIPHNENILWNEQGAPGVEYMLKRMSTSDGAPRDNDYTNRALILKQLLLT